MKDESTTVDPPTLRPETFGKYELLERLGSGGMADVWRARVVGQSGFQRTVVLKRILPHLVSDEKARLLFEREARVVSRLSHAHIVQVFEFGDVMGEYYLAMELVDGQDIASMIRAGVLTPAAAAYVLRDVCRALAYAYGVRGDDGIALRILHRDVSPSNIMVGYDGAVRLLDFGIAKALSDPRDKRTMKGTIRGKFGYMAPEIIEGLDPDQRADVFSVGVVLHEMLTGRRLFRGTTDLETLAQVRRGQIPFPSSINADVPRALDEICMRALSRDRGQRFSGGNELAELLDDVARELRFGPTQMAVLVARVRPAEQPLGFSSNTLTGNTSDLHPPSERATDRMSTKEIARLAARSQAQPVLHADPGPSQRVGSSPALPPKQRAGAMSYVLAGVLCGALIVAAVFLGRMVGEAHHSAATPSSEK
ncbi:MAG: serine/threonine-protein kinase [Polyangia bacterium]